MSISLGVQGVPFISSSQATDQHCLSTILTAVIDTVKRIWTALVNVIQMIFCGFSSSETPSVRSPTAPAIAPVAAPADNLDNLILTIDQQNAIKNAPLVREFRTWLSSVSANPNFLNHLDSMIISVTEEQRPFLRLARAMNRQGAAALFYYISVSPSQYKLDLTARLGPEYANFVRLRSEIESLLPEAIHTGNAGPLYNIVPLVEQDMSAHVRASMSLDLDDIVATTPIHCGDCPSPLTSEIVLDIRRVDGFVRFLAEASNQSHLDEYLARTLADSNREIVGYASLLQNYLRRVSNLSFFGVFMRHTAFIALLPTAIRTGNAEPLLELMGVRPSADRV
ncbi:MAG TPA: hypothetical protein VIJ46_05670 [Rhabdochlamydiaceae bacterium]